jgi:prepilin-type N-terminal cleavage/methylation domain-containing protein
MQINNSGFTLLELLIVVAVLATLAGGVILSLGGIEDDTSLNLSKNEMLEIKKALIRFKQDTGFLPRQGPFDLAPPNGSGVVPLPVEGENWFKSPANFSQIYENPLASTTHFLRAWNPDTSRGWRGPYLTQHGEGLVDLGNGLNADGTGSPIAGTTLLLNIRGVADPFVMQPEPCPPLGNCFVWRTIASSPAHFRWGRPYFLFNLNDPLQARIVGMGADGTYGTTDDLSLFLFK